VILEKDLDEKILYNYINEIIYNNDKLKAMSESAKSLSKPDALDQIVDLMYTLARS
jgi:hypothetical protein